MKMIKSLTHYQIHLYAFNQHQISRKSSNILKFIIFVTFCNDFIQILNIHHLIKKTNKLIYIKIVFLSEEYCRWIPLFIWCIIILILEFIGLYFKATGLFYLHCILIYCSWPENWTILTGQTMYVNNNYYYFRTCNNKKYVS
jgi:hypothetical protein